MKDFSTRINDKQGISNGGAKKKRRRRGEGD
jgi:hypothetical protein